MANLFSPTRFGPEGSKEGLTERDWKNGYRAYWLVLSKSYTLERYSSMRLE
jgi:hypothetical protein